MNNAWDKVNRALRWTFVLFCLVLCIQGRPPMRGQDGTTTATIGGITTAVAIQNKDIAQLYAEQHTNEASISKMQDKIESMDRDFYTFEARINTFGAILVFIGAGNIAITWKKKKSEG